MRRVGAQRPRLAREPQEVASLAAGDDAIVFAESLGLELDDWQQWCVRMLLAERADGTLAAGTGILLVPRQNGKNVVLAVVELYGLCIAGLRRQVHSAHLGDTAGEHLKFLKDLILDNELDDEQGGYLRIYETNGKERIVNVETRGELSFNTRTKSTKRGTPPQRIVFDEALFLTDEQQQAMLPALAAQSLNADTFPQIIVTSSAPLPESVTLQRYRVEALAGAPGVFLADWGCDPPPAGMFGDSAAMHQWAGDRDRWYESNPSLGIRIAEEFVERMEWRFLTPEAFAIERLGVVFDVDVLSSELPEWGHCVDDGSQIDGDPTALAVDVAEDLSWSSIAVAGRRADGVAHVEVVDHLPRTDGVVEIVAAIAGIYGLAVQLDPRSPAGGLVSGLRAAGVDVVEVGGVELVKACAALKREVAERAVRHRGQGPLDAAVSGASIAASGDGWRWARRSSHVDISPLVAVTLALHAHRSGRQRSHEFAIVL